MDSYINYIATNEWVNAIITIIISEGDNYGINNKNM